MRSIVVTVVFIMAIDSGWVSPAMAQTTYTALNLGTLPGGLSAGASGINNSGQVVGTAITAAALPQAFLYNGGIISLGSLPGGIESEAYGIANNGQVAGWASSGAYPLTAFLYSGGTMTAIVTEAEGYSQAYAISNSGVVGTFNNGIVMHAFLYANGTTTDLGSLAGASGVSFAYGINDSGQVVGSSQTVIGGSTVHAFLYSSGTMTDLGTLPGFTSSQANAINNSGQIVGVAYNGSATNGTAFLYTNGTMTNLGALPGYQYSQATGINSSGQIVGTAYDSVSTPFLYSNGVMTNLDSVVIGPKLGLESASGINDLGQIAASGDGTAYLLTPGENDAGKLFGQCGCSTDPNAPPPPPGQFPQGDPITISTGNLFEQVTDYTTAGQNPLAFTRYYNSLENTAPSATFATTLGVNWRSTYDRYLRIVSPTSVTAERANGQQLIFTLTGGVWTPDTDVDITLTNAGATWTLADHNDTVETYTSISATEAQLNTIKARNGYTQALAYNGSNQLTTVTDSYSRSLTLAYSSGLLQSVATPDSTTVSFGYTASGSGNVLTSATYSTSPATTVTYQYTNTSLPYALTEIIDEDGNQYKTWTYDSQGRALTSELGKAGTDANLTTVVYDSATSVSVTNALGVTDTYTFATLQGIPKTTQISRAATKTTAPATETFSFDSNGYLASATDWNGNLTTYVNDIHGDPTTINEAVGTSVARTTTIAYDPTFVHLPSTITTQGLTTSLVYNANEDVLTKTLTDTTTTTEPYVTSGQTRTWAYTWLNFLLASVETPNGDLTQYGYDATGALTSTTNALSQVTNVTQNTGGGYPLTIVDPNNVTTTLTYNARLWLLTSTISAASQPSFTTTWGYDATGNLTSLTLPDKSKLTYGYDTAHRLVSVTDLFSNNIAYTLDPLGDVTLTKVSNPKGKVERKHSGVFDALGRVLKDIGGVGQTTAYTWDNNGNALTITDPGKNLTTQTFDALNRLSMVKDALGGLTVIVYDQHDRVIGVLAPNDTVTAYEYDGFGDDIWLVSADTGATVYVYDADGNLTQKTDAAGAITNNTYDALDRVLTTTYPGDASENVAYTYDQAAHGFGIGHLTTLKDAVGSLSRNYDERGNMLTESRVNGKTSMKTVYTYDPASRVASITYPSTSIVSYTRDIMGRIIRVSAKTPGATTYSSVASGVAYEPFGPTTGFTFGNGVTDARGYDLDYRMTSLTDTGTATVQNIGYGYDPANNVLNITDNVSTSNSQTLVYDPLNRLKTATSGAGGYGSLAWTYDAVGNRLTQTANSVLATYAYTPGSNQLATITTGTTVQNIGTTAAGNISSFSPPMNGVTALSYNQANRLATVTAGTKELAKYTYDAFGQRLRKTTTTGTLYQFDQSGNLLEEAYTTSAGPVDYIYLGAQPVATLTPGTGAFAYLHTDHLSTPQLATNSTQAIAWSASGYQPFGSTGTVIGTITQNLRLPGQYFDAESSFYHNGFRDYMPNLGRYLESDPIGLAGGENSYAYVRNNPNSRVDLLGLRDIVAVVWGSRYSGYLYGNGSVGHVFLGEVNGDVILSQFPDPRGSSFGTNTTLDWTDTLNAEGRSPDGTFHIYVPDDYAFDTAVAALRSDRNWYWNPKFDNSTNCTDSAYLALTFGGVNLNIPGIPWTPNNFLDSMNALVGKNAFVAKLASIPWE